MAMATLGGTVGGQKKKTGRDTGFKLTNSKNANSDNSLNAKFLIFPQEEVN